MPNERTREPFRCQSRAPRTKNDRVFGPRAVYGARMAASNDLRVNPSHFIQPTIGLYRWYVHIPTYGRYMPSPPADFACDGGAMDPCLRSTLDGQTNVSQVTTPVPDDLVDVVYQWHRNGACGFTHWLLPPHSSRSARRSRGFI